MKFMDSIFTQEGPGVVVARSREGGLLVALNPREVVVGENGKREVKRFPGAIRLMRLCPVHGVWFWQGCELCEMEKEVKQ